MNDIIMNIVNNWDRELSKKYGGELEIDYEDGKYYACAFHDEAKIIDGKEYDSWIEKIKEIDCLGSSFEIEDMCSQHSIPVCH